MRKVVVHMQTTLDNRIANGDGQFWEPFPWGDTEAAYVNQFFRQADTWAMSRIMYDAIVPWWEAVAEGQLPSDAPPMTPAFADFAGIQRQLHKVVFSRSMAARQGVTVLNGDLAAHLSALKAEDGATIVLSCGPATLGPLASTPGLVDEYVTAVHPAALADGPRMFDHLTRDLALELVEAQVFDGGALVLHHRVLPLQSRATT